MDNLGRSYLQDKIITSLSCWAHYNLTHELKVLYGYPLKIMVSFQPMSYCKELEEFPKVVLIFTWDPLFRIRRRLFSLFTAWAFRCFPRWEGHRSHVSRIPRELKGQRLPPLHWTFLSQKINTD